jgi:hypothetical protein
VSVVPVSRTRFVSRWQDFEAWVGTRSSAVALFALALAAFALQSVALPVHPGRDMGRFVQAYLQLFYEEPVLPSVLNTRGPLSALGVGIPLELGGVATEVWLAVLYAASIVAWGVVALTFGPRVAVLTTGLLLASSGYGMLFHGLASDAIFAAGFAGWAVLLSRAILRPSVTTFLLAGLGMGTLVLVRPSNQALIVMALVPLALRAPWSRRLTWMASFFVASAAVTQGWKALADLRYSDAVALKPSMAVCATALLLLPLFFPAVWRRRVLVLALPLLVVTVAIWGLSVQNPVQYVRTLAQSPSSSVFLFRAFEVDRIVSPDNGPASRELARVVQRELLAQEPYRSYDIGLDEFFSSGSDRMYVDLASLAGADLNAVTEEAILEHPWTFTSGVARTSWAMLWDRRVYGPEDTGEEEASAPPGQEGTVVIDGRTLPRPSEGEPIPASRFGPAIHTLRGPVREVWRSPTDHPLVFDDPRDERRYLEFERDTARLSDRIPTRESNPGLVHRLNQASRAFPPPLVWLALGLLALAVRRPRRALVALALSGAGLVVLVATSLVVPAQGEYVAPVSPAFILLAAAGLVGAHPRGRLILSRRRQPDRAEHPAGP